MLSVSCFACGWFLFHPVVGVMGANGHVTLLVACILSQSWGFTMLWTLLGSSSAGNVEFIVPDQPWERAGGGPTFKNVPSQILKTNVGKVKSHERRKMDHGSPKKKGFSCHNWALKHRMIFHDCSAFLVAMLLGFQDCWRGKEVRLWSLISM